MSQSGHWEWGEVKLLQSHYRILHVAVYEVNPEVGFVC